jgi:hypothetical protein
MYNAYIHTYIHTYNIVIHIHTYIRLYYKHTSIHPVFRINGPCRFDDPPSASHRGGAPPGPKKAAHTPDNEVTDAVFHAPMFALNADADWNACEPSRTQSTPTESAGTFRRGFVGAQSHTHARARARTQHVGACARRARIDAPFIGAARRAWI